MRTDLNIMIVVFVIFVFTFFPFGMMWLFELLFKLFGEDEQVSDKGKLIAEIKKRGFKEVTDKEPIAMIEMFGDTFSEFYAYSNRFLKEEFGFKHYLLLEVYHKRIEIEGMVIHNFGIDKFHLNGILPYYFLVVNHTIEIIDAIKKKNLDHINKTKGGLNMKARNKHTSEECEIFWDMCDIGRRCEASDKPIRTGIPCRDYNAVVDDYEVMTKDGWVDGLEFIKNPYSYKLR